MISPDTLVLSFPLALALAGLTFGLVMSFYRLVRGPTLPDRVVALDLITLISVGVLLVSAIATDQAGLLDVAIVVSLIAFLGTVAFAMYLQRRATG